MTAARTAGPPSCPVCAGAGRPLLALPAQPIYQHPVDADVVIPAPHAVDLSWVACVDCAHAWQPHFDSALLEQIYRSHYYTPAPDGIGVQFRNEFLAALDAFGLLMPRQSLLEIGASNGDVLAELRTRTGAARVHAYEPDQQNARLARQRGLDVRERFFGATVGRDDIDPVDLVYARHVIEHVFDFDDFFAGLQAIARPAADLILETPSLDHHAARGSLAPFHVEHVHVFSLRSLTRLAARHGWSLRHSQVTAPGNLIAAFGKGTAAAQTPAPSLDGLQEAVSRQRVQLQRLFAGRRLVFWGAGSAGAHLASLIGREPDVWTDGNPAKVGKHFAGSTRSIISPERAFAEAKASTADAPVLVITSSFVDEILPRVRQLGWQGEIVDLGGNRV
ncbi:MAG TPA: class I SAM-dependent methyltransferase [Steroidobacteraceae bacterium]|jgi:hypothetical protein|nr:class I SAM-dependent methyltransferase [Steroidobacteraceae bacterium]